MKVLRVLVFLLAAVGLIPCATAQVAQPEKPPFTIIISTPQNVVKAGSDVRLEVTMTNTSDHDVFYTVGTGPIINMDIRDAEGKPVPETPDGRRIHGTDRGNRPVAGGVGSVANLPIKPGQTAFGGEERIVSKEYDLSRHGKYTIQAVRTDPASQIVVKSNTITVTVTP